MRSQPTGSRAFFQLPGARQGFPLSLLTPSRRSGEQSSLSGLVQGRQANLLDAAAQRP
jgi:hypothetical protein